MNALPLAILLLPFGLFLVIFFCFLGFNIYHLRVYGVQSFLTQSIITFFLVGTVVVLGAAWLMLGGSNWSHQIELEEITKPFTAKKIFTPL